MAVTKIIPIRSTIDKSIDYICNPNKTEECKYIFSENCFPQTAAVEFEIYLQSAQAGGNTIGRHLIQSFAPNETTPELAHEIGKKLAAEILGGQYAYVMATHVDRNHIHNHFVWCAVNIETHKRYRSNKGTYHHIQSVSDRLCEENSLSVIKEKSGRRGRGYIEYQAERQGNSWKAKLRAAIDNSIAAARDYDEFLRRMQSAGYEIKRGKYISFRAPKQERFMRAKTLGTDYTEERIIQRIQGEKQAVRAPERSLRRVIDIEGNEKIASSPGYKFWATRKNLKIKANTLIYLQEHDLCDMNEFNIRYNSAVGNYSRAQEALSASEGRINELKELQQQLRIYGRTKDNYKLYQSARDKDKFLRENYSVESDVMLHEAAKRYFNKYTAEHGKPLPKMKAVATELATLKSSKRQQYAEYQSAKSERDTMLKLRVNLQAMVGRDVVRERSSEVVI